jgi:hypothetical protein
MSADFWPVAQKLARTAGDSEILIAVLDSDPVGSSSLWILPFPALRRGVLCRSARGRGVRPLSRVDCALALAATRRTMTAPDGAERNPGLPHPMRPRPNGSHSSSAIPRVPGPTPRPPPRPRRGSSPPREPATAPASAVHRRPRSPTAKSAGPTPSAPAGPCGMSAPANPPPTAAIHHATSRMGRVIGTGNGRPEASRCVTTSSTTSQSSA